MAPGNCITERTMSDVTKRGAPMWMSPLEVMKLSIGLADFTCCQRNHMITTETQKVMNGGKVKKIPCDKPIAGGILEQLIDAKINHLFNAECDMVMARLHSCFKHWWMRGLKKKEMILISQKAEHNYAGVNCGIMDQYASMFGKNNKAFMLDCRSLKSKSYKIKLRKLKFVLVNTNVKHDLSESAYNNRRSVCEKVAELLKVKALRDASEEQLQKIKDHISDSDYNKALYVIKENDRVQKFAQAIKKNNYSAMGALMYKSHEGLSENYKVSCDELDFLVERTKAMPEVYGARMMGGGFGGCTINLMLGNFVEDFKSEIENGFLKEFDRTCSIYEVNIAKGTHLINAKNE